MTEWRANFHDQHDELNKPATAKLRPRDAAISRRLENRFGLHFHPYAQELVEALKKGSVQGLQDADTQYVTNSDGSWQAVPNTTVVTLLRETRAQLLGGALVLPAGTPLILFDTTAVLLPSGNQSTHWDVLLDGLRFTVSGGSETIAFGDRIRLASAQPVHRPSEVDVTLPANTELVLRKSSPRPQLWDGQFFKAVYNPSFADDVSSGYPAKTLDFSVSGAYSTYNWELFFHAPITIAIHLSRNQRFADAMHWFHYVFDPTSDSEGSSPLRFWKFKPFQSTEARSITEILVNLSTGADGQLRDDTVNAIHAWRKAPFRPHLIARYRPAAFMVKTLMAYLDNLIAWGDSLFREDTRESINEATQLYALASSILGPRPQVVPRHATTSPRSYNSIRNGLDAFGDVLVRLETEIPFDVLSEPGEARQADRAASTLSSIAQILYFCVPSNDKLLGYWDTVADRLFKIHNSLNILGVFRQVPLFDPPIDPALLASATAAGIDVAAIVNGINQPLPLVRFQLLIRHALEIVQEVKSLGNSVLAAMEKEDAEAIALLRARHEGVVLKLVEDVRYGQLQEAAKSKEALLSSLALAVERYTFYERQLGKGPADIVIPVLGELDRDSLRRMNLVAVEPAVAARPIEVDIAQDLGESGGRIVSRYELDELVEMRNASNARNLAAGLDMNAKLLALIPEFGGHVQPIGVGMTIAAGGRMLSAVLSYAADFHRINAEQDAYAAAVASKIGGYFRREQDWALQSNLAAREINQIFKQLRAAQIREAVAELDLKAHRQQIANAAEFERFLNEDGADKAGKTTNKALYAWMKREAKGVFAQCFQFAFDTARKAERALQHEVGDPKTSYLQFGYLAGKEGFLAGEKLYLDIKRMALAFEEVNQREYEMVKHASLNLIDPFALLQLRQTGQCTLRLAESLFDMDGPGHYFRRLKTVAVSVPCVAGPYASVNCTLSLLKSAIRVKPVLHGDRYARENGDDDRFDDYFGNVQSIVTSSGQSDSGLFEVSLRDERYLPFENAGAISDWRLQLPANPAKGQPQQFDYGTISDVILHLRYTAREGGELLRNAALLNLRDTIAAGDGPGGSRLFSVRRDFPGEWAKFTSGRPLTAGQRAELSLELRPEHYPLWTQNGLSVDRFDIFAKASRDTANTVLVLSKPADDGSQQQDQLVSDSNRTLGNFRSGRLVNIQVIPIGRLKLFFSDNSMEDVFLLIRTKSGDG